MSSKDSSMEKCLSQNAHYETKSVTELVTKFLMKFEKAIDGYFASLGKDRLAYIRNLFTANATVSALYIIAIGSTDTEKRRCRMREVLKRNWLNFNMMVAHTTCILRNSYVNFWFMMCNSYKKLMQPVITLIGCKRDPLKYIKKWPPTQDSALFFHYSTRTSWMNKIKTFL